MSSPETTRITREATTAPQAALPAVVPEKEELRLPSFARPEPLPKAVPPARGGGRGGLPPPPVDAARRTLASEWDDQTEISLARPLGDPLTFQPGELKPFVKNGAQSTVTANVEMPSTGYLVKAYGPFVTESGARLTFKHNLENTKFDGIILQQLRIGKGEEVILFLTWDTQRIGIVIPVKPRQQVAGCVILEAPSHRLPDTPKFPEA